MFVQTPELVLWSVYDPLATPNAGDGTCSILPEIPEPSSRNPGFPPERLHHVTLDLGLESAVPPNGTSTPDFDAPDSASGLKPSESEPCDPLVVFSSFVALHKA